MHGRGVTKLDEIECVLAEADSSRKKLVEALKEGVFSVESFPQFLTEMAGENAGEKEKAILLVFGLHADSRYWEIDAVTSLNDLR